MSRLLILLVLIVSIINSINGLNIANRIVSLTNKLRNKDNNNNNISIPKIVPLKEKKSIGNTYGLISFSTIMNHNTYHSTHILGTKVKGIFNNIITLPLVAVKGIKDITYITIDTASTIASSYDSKSSSTLPIDIIEQTKDSIINNIEITKENIGNVGDAIIEFPSNIANDVTKSIDEVSSSIVSVSSTIASIPNNIVTTTRNVKRTVKSILKVPGIVLNSAKGAIDSIYDIADKINGIDAIPQTKASVVYGINNKNNNNEKSPSEIIDEIKEAVYMTADTVTGTINAVQDNIPKIINTIEEIPTIPTKVVSTYKQTEKDINDKVIEIQNGFENAKENSIKIGKVFYKIITLEAAKETAARINNNYQTLVTSIDKTRSVIVGTKDVIVNFNKPKPPAPKKGAVIEKISNTISVIGETVKVTSGVTIAFGKIGFTIFEGIGKVATITYNSIGKDSNNDINPANNNNLIIPDAVENNNPISPVQVQEKEEEIVQEKEEKLITPGEWK